MTRKKTIKDANYKVKVAVQDEKGIIDYDPEKMKDVVGGERLSYKPNLIMCRENINNLI